MKWVSTIPSPGLGNSAIGKPPWPRVCKRRLAGCSVDAAVEAGPERNFSDAAGSSVGGSQRQVMGRESDAFRIQPQCRREFFREQLRRFAVDAVGPAIGQRQTV